MSCQHKLFSRISALSEKSLCLTGNSIKTLVAILFLIVGGGWGVKLKILGKKISDLFNYYKRMLKI